MLIILNSITSSHAITTPEKPQDDVWITVFIHGIINIKPHLSLSNLIRFMRDQITDSIYAHAVEIIRKDPFFYQYYAMNGLGLQQIETHLKQQEGNASGAFAIAYDAISSLNETCTTKKNIYYTFGWSGLLSTQVRYQEAALFYEALTKEVEKYKAQGIHPKVRVIGYSHGGYIALNLGAVFNTLKKPSHDWLVDELYLIGVPVISDSDFLINSALFKTVYHFYSPGDRVQVVDCLATNRFFSHRTFSPRIGFSLPDKLIQVQFRCKRVARTRFAQTGCKHHPNHYPPRLLRNADPGHTELWSFGWTAGYRTYLPIYPFPAGAYLSYIVNAIKTTNNLGNHIIADIRPFQNSMLLSSLDVNKKLTVSFPTQQDHNHIQTLINPFTPIDCSKKLYEIKAQQALCQATEHKKQEWKLRRRIKK